MTKTHAPSVGGPGWTLVRGTDPHTATKIQPQSNKEFLKVIIVARPSEVGAMGTQRG